MTRRILLITAGETPQLLTETIYGLLTRAPTPWVPDSIIIATTARGASLFEEGGGPRALPALLGRSGKLRQLYGELGLASAFVEPELLLPRSLGGAILPDIRSADEVSAFAQCLLDRVRTITADDQSELHLSIAGGRKTMSFIAGQVMSLCGRSRDVLSHCLVEPSNLEGQADFWWPLKGGAPARIDLHDVPYIRLSAFTDASLILPDGPASYEDAVRIANDALAANSVLADFNDRSITAGAKRLVFNNARDFAAYATLLLATREGAILKRLKIPDIIDGKPVAPRTVIGWNQNDRRFSLMFGLCWELLQLRRIYEGFPENVGTSPMRLLETAESRANGFQLTDYNTPIADAGKAIRDRYESNLAQRLLHREGKGLASCAIQPENIGFKLPYELDLDELVDALIARQR